MCANKTGPHTFNFPFFIAAEFGNNLRTIFNNASCCLVAQHTKKKRGRRTQNAFGFLRSREQLVRLVCSIYSRRRQPRTDVLEPYILAALATGNNARMPNAKYATAFSGAAVLLYYLHNCNGAHCVVTQDPESKVLQHKNKHQHIF